MNQNNNRDENTIIDELHKDAKPLSHPWSVKLQKPVKNSNNKWLIIALSVVLVVMVGVAVFLLLNHKDKSTGKIATVSNSADEIETVEELFDYGKDNVITVNGVAFKMKYVPGGTFHMGSTASDAYSDERPVHEVSLYDFLIGETEVTQELWEAVMGYNPSHFVGAKRPVECVSHNDCIEFIERLNANDEVKQLGIKFRLPTEAEWEYAAGGGSDSRQKFAGCNSAYQLDDYAWYEANSGGRTHDVAQKLPNKLGLYDMNGNVWEWCQDWMHSYYRSSGNASSGNRTARGGSWKYPPRYQRVTNRGKNIPSMRHDGLGVRLAI